MKHTLGLWMLHDTESATVVTVEKPGRFIALCSGIHLTKEEAEANAFRIALLPEIIEALVLLAGELEYEVPVSPSLQTAQENAKRALKQLETAST